MSECIEQRRKRARKRHFCDWCHSPIEIGEEYTYSRNVTDGHFHSWKECDKCGDLVQEMFSKGYDSQKGYCDSADFSEFMIVEYGMSFNEYQVGMQKIDRGTNK